MLSLINCQGFPHPSRIWSDVMFVSLELSPSRNQWPKQLANAELYCQDQNTMQNLILNVLLMSVISNVGWTTSLQKSIDLIEFNFLGNLCVYIHIDPYHMVYDTISYYFICQIPKYTFTPVLKSFLVNLIMTLSMILYSVYCNIIIYEGLRIFSNLYIKTLY